MILHDVVQTLIDVTEPQNGSLIPPALNIIIRSLDAVTETLQTTNVSDEVYNFVCMLAVFCLHWSVVVGPTITQRILTTTQTTFTTTETHPTFTTTNALKVAKCYIYTHNLTTTNISWAVSCIMSVSFYA